MIPIGYWVGKKMPMYCRPHGERILGWVNGVGLCRYCLTDLATSWERGTTMTVSTTEPDGTGHSNE
jgi:hypothetical protein